MPWVVGIDEAGYGPNLGPFVMSLAAVHVPPALGHGELWGPLGEVVRRAGGTKDERIVVDDSKLVYAPAAGVASLERHLLPFLWDGDEQPCALECLWQRCCCTPLSEWHAEPWFGPIALPLHSACCEWSDARQRLLAAAERLPLTFLFATVLIFPRQFNTLLAAHQSKAAAPAWALGRLLARLPAPLDDAPTKIMVDKLGGRNRYHPLLQDIFPDCFVMTRGESAARSSYQVLRPQGTCEITFQPEADRRCFPVALASMGSKYLREVMMDQFNRFWQTQVPGLKPTAGYPGDAARFYHDIRAARERLGISDDVLWRAR